MCVQIGMSLKLTQVPHLAKTLDLDQEAKWVAVAFNDARELMTNRNRESSEFDASTLLHNRAIKKLHSSIERWGLVEDRLQNGISNSDQVRKFINNRTTHGTTTMASFSHDLLMGFQIRTRVFDEAVSVIAAGRVLLGQLFWQSKGDDMALKELEASCPTLWEYDVARTSLDNDVSSCPL